MKRLISNNRPDYKTSRLSEEQLNENFKDIHPALNPRSAVVEAERCYYCYDAPCITACPTRIDIPKFIRQIETADIDGAAQTIFTENIMGGMCARVCPTENLCQGACVRMTDDEKPVQIGLLQRFATDHAIDESKQYFKRKACSSKRVAIVGSGAAGLACAHELAKLGHEITIFEKRAKASGLNEYGVATYKTTDNFAQREVDYILALGGITIKTNQSLFDDFTLDSLTKDYDAVFLGLGLDDVTKVEFNTNNNLPQSKLSGIFYAVDFIEEIRQSEDLSKLLIPNRVAVIGGGMTAIDIACQIKRLGAEQVEIIYRKGQENMPASEVEIDFAKSCEVGFRYWSVVSEIISNDQCQVIGVEISSSAGESATNSKNNLEILPIDALFLATGQKLSKILQVNDLKFDDKGRILVDEDKKTSIKKVWAGGDCTSNGYDLVVASVEDGKIAAKSIDENLVH